MMNVPDEVVLVCLAGLTSEPAGAGWEDGALHQGLPGQQQGDRQQHPLQSSRVSAAGTYKETGLR